MCTMSYTERAKCNSPFNFISLEKPFETIHIYKSIIGWNLYIAKMNTFYITLKNFHKRYSNYTEFIFVFFYMLWKTRANCWACN